MNAKKALVAASIATAMILGTGAASFAETTATPAPTASQSASDKAAAKAAAKAARLAAELQYRTDLAKWQVAKAAYEVSAAPIRAVFTAAASKANETLVAALKVAADDTARKAARDAFKAALSAAKSTRDAALAALPKVPTKPTNPNKKD
ncbi:MAG: hypothetical protein RL454_232 [Actinomycetota bacterium]